MQAKYQITIGNAINFTFVVIHVTRALIAVCATDGEKDTNIRESKTFPTRFKS